MEVRLRLFFASFCVCSETNAIRCLVTNQTAFSTMGHTKKLSLKRNFYKQFLHVFLTEFRKTLFVFVFQKRF